MTASASHATSATRVGATPARLAALLIAVEQAVRR